MARTLESIFDIKSMVTSKLWARQQQAKQRDRVEQERLANDYRAAEKYVERIRTWIENERSNILRRAKEDDLAELRAYQRVLDKLEADRKHMEAIRNG